MAGALQHITVLGATGSIGASTLDVVARHPGRYRVFAVTANRSVAKLKQICRDFGPRYAVVADAAAAGQLTAELAAIGCATEVLAGESGLIHVAAHPQVDTVMAAIVGAVGLKPTLAAANAGKRVLLANKEALVMGGDLFMAAVRHSGARLLPIDSEHNAIFQCLPEHYASLAEAGVSKILLTGSGGPFRDWDLARLPEATPEQACKHPNWSMGQKISVDSATMMNKGLEFIEACWLFKARPEDIQIVLHPQSVVHSMVQYRDGSVLAQLGNPDMRTPIAHSLAWPERISSGVAALDFARLAGLSFGVPDVQRFPCLPLAMAAMVAGGDAPAALNAANEVAVAAFLGGRIRFTAIAAVIAAVMKVWPLGEPQTIDAVINADARARALASAEIERLTD